MEQTIEKRILQRTEQSMEVAMEQKIWHERGTGV